MTASGFGEPSNWCDRRCERCPLADGCALHLRERQRRWVHEARGQDPDDPAVGMDDLVNDLERALELLREAAQEEGLDPDDVSMPESPVVLDAVRLQKLGTLIAAALHDEDAVRAVATTVAIKTARISSYLTLREEPGSNADAGWDDDVAPNLLLIERLRGEVAGWLEVHPELPLEDARQALVDLDRIVDPLLARVDAAARARLAGLIERRGAPSPFCVTDA